jgi:hypothetical protein
MRILLACAAMLVTGAASAIDCSAPAPAAAVAPTPLVAPLDPALQPASLPVAGDPLAAGADPALAVDAVLTRLRTEQCARPVDAFAGYQKRTEFDNTPYRFNMKPGQKLSPAEFDAWMASRGIRIVKAKTEPAAATQPVAPTASN